MNFIQVTDIGIPELKIYHQMRENAFKEDGSFIADSPKVVNLLLEQDIEIRSIFATQEYYDKYADLIETKVIPALYVASKEVMEKIVGHTVHHNVMMHAIRPAPTP
ncbi:MAG: RNA methyltransferase, partial [Sulfurovum sp.]|nr:RNA methyltransferase [Sulfurovum sp.]